MSFPNVNLVSKSNMKIALGAVGVMALMIVAMQVAQAATTGTEFQSLHTQIVGWAEGYLGKALAIAALVVGGVVGFAKSTAMPALVGVVFAIVFGIGPSIINGMMTATI